MGPSCYGAEEGSSWVNQQLISPQLQIWARPDYLERGFPQRKLEEQRQKLLFSLPSLDWLVLVSGEELERCFLSVKSPLHLLVFISLSGRVGWDRDFLLLLYVVCASLAEMGPVTTKTPLGGPLELHILQETHSKGPTKAHGWLCFLASEKKAVPVIR